MNNADEYGTLLTVSEGYLMCPHCMTVRIKSHLLKVTPDTVAQRLTLFCRRCKHELLVNIVDGQCYESPRR